jgi:hypothetical protein
VGITPTEDLPYLADRQQTLFPKDFEGIQFAFGWKADGHCGSLILLVQ